MNLRQTFQKPNRTSSESNLHIYYRLYTCIYIYRDIVNTTHALDPTRPVTFACYKQVDEDLVVSNLLACCQSSSAVSNVQSQFMDVLMINQYFAWYTDTGHPELIAKQMSNKLDEWYDKHTKPIMVSEYGAGTLPGLHRYPPSAWSEEYQVGLGGVV